MIKPALEVYKHCYNQGRVDTIPADWQITKNFKWAEAFKNETKADGVPGYEVFQRIERSAGTFQLAREFIDAPFIIHCWYRCVLHNQRAGSVAYLSPHIYGNAIDFHVAGMNCAEVRKKLLKADLPLRIEDGTTTWVHLDTGNTFIKDGYKFGLFRA